MSDEVPTDWLVGYTQMKSSMYFNYTFRTQCNHCILDIVVVIINCTLAQPPTHNSHSISRRGWYRTFRGIEALNQQAFDSFGTCTSHSQPDQLFLIFRLQFIHFTANKSFYLHLFVFGAFSSPRLMEIRSSLQLNNNTLLR